MSIDIRLVGREQSEEFSHPLRTAFGVQGTPERTERMRTLTELGTRIAAFDGNTIVGSAGVYAFDFSTTGGRSVPTAGLTLVAVQPTHRRRGILHGMMKKHFEEARGHGQPIGALWASEASIYGRFGYGLASFAGSVGIEKHRAAFIGTNMPFEARFVNEAEAAEVMPPIYERARATRPGMPSRSPVWWAQRRIGDFTPTGPAGGPLQRVVVSIDGRAEAYALYRVRLDFDHESQLPGAVVTVMEAVGGSPAGTRAVWRYLCDIDLATKILSMNLPPNHALLLLLAEPRRAHYTAYDALWARIIDVPEALAARTYGAKDSIVLEIEDTSCPWNNGRYRLDAGEARAHRTNEPADLRLPASSLGSAYLGGISFARLAEVGAVEQKTEHAIERADRIFHVARAPWCPEVF